MLKLTKFLQACDIPVNLDSYKIHLAVVSGTSSPLNAYFAGKFKEWQEEQNQRNFSKDMVIGLIGLGNDRWLFGGVYRINSCVSEGDLYRYDTTLISGQDDYIGRLIVKHERTGRASYRIGDADGGLYFIDQLLPQKLTVQEFPGYNKVHINNATLKIIISQNIESWRSALSNVKGIYLIGNELTGKVYVGKADGNSGIWQRWCDYALNGHGENKGLRSLLDLHGADYSKNFWYSILEIADTHASSDDILKRESYWMNILRSRNFGYNLGISE